MQSTIEIVHAPIHQFITLVNSRAPCFAIDHTLLEVLFVFLHFLLEGVYDGYFSTCNIHLNAQVNVEVFELFEHLILISVIDKVLLRKHDKRLDILHDDVSDRCLQVVCLQVRVNLAKVDLV